MNKQCTIISTIPFLIHWLYLKGCGSFELSWLSILKYCYVIFSSAQCWKYINTHTQLLCDSVRSSHSAITLHLYSARPPKQNSHIQYLCFLHDRYLIVIHIIVLNSQPNMHFHIYRQLFESVIYILILMLVLTFLVHYCSCYIFSLCKDCKILINCPNHISTLHFSQ